MQVNQADLNAAVAANQDAGTDTAVQALNAANGEYLPNQANELQSLTKHFPTALLKISVTTTAFPQLTAAVVNAAAAATTPAAAAAATTASSAAAAKGTASAKKNKNKGNN